jgi:hypothetical protein
MARRGGKRLSQGDFSCYPADAARQVCCDCHAPWGWTCGFYPGSEPGEFTNGTGATFEEAREKFEAAWRMFLARRTEADFQAYRDDRDWPSRAGLAMHTCAIRGRR